MLRNLEIEGDFKVILLLDLLWDSYNVFIKKFLDLSI